MHKIFLDLLEILGCFVSCNLTFIRLIDFTTAIVFTAQCYGYEIACRMSVSLSVRLSVSDV